MAAEDLTRTGPWAGGSPPSASGSEPFTVGQTRIALRRLARTRQRRRWTVEGLTVLACLVALVSYLGTEQQSEPREERRALPDGAPTVPGRPVFPFPGVEGPGANAGAVSPGLRPRQHPPSPSPTPSPARTTNPPAGPVLTVNQADVPAVVDLTAFGARDWVHWGLRGGDSIVRKRDGSGEIRDEGGSGGRDSYDTNPEGFSWRDGSPVESVDATFTGVHTCDVGNGFALAVAADGELRTVRLYAGLWMARARLDVRLSSGGPTTTLWMEDPHTNHTAEFTIRFRAPKGAKLLMSWTAEESFNGGGNVGLQAVALR